MTQYNTLNVKLSISQLNKLKSAIKNETEVTLNLSSNLIRNSKDETNFPHKLSLSNTKVSKICKAFSNGSNEEMNDIMKIVKSLEESGLLIKGVSENIKNEAKEQKRGFLGMLLDTLNG